METSTAVKSSVMIRADGLKKRFGTNVAVDGVSFEIPTGEVFGLLGPNGAGKSTTIGMMIGALRPDEGSVSIGGTGNPMQPNVRKSLGVAPQTLALYEEMTAEENLLFFARLYGLSGKHLYDRLLWSLDLAGLTDRRRDVVRTFSGGMKRRLNLACALVHEPGIVFLDEPTVGVDPQSRNYIFESVERLRDEGLTVVYTTHYMEEAQRLCHRVAIMDAGRILALDSVDELIRQHGGNSLVNVEFSRPPQELAGLEGQIDGTTLKIPTEQPFQEIARLSGLGVPITRLQVEQPDLESVFLNLTGRKLRD